MKLRVVAISALAVAVALGAACKKKGGDAIQIGQ
jgi:hypothetical protein